MTKTIPRVKFLNDEAAPARKQLAIDARKLLGYSRLADAISAPDTLMSTLRHLEIEPLVRREVENYKRRKARPGMWSGHKKGWRLVGLAITSAAIATYINGRISWATFTPAALVVILMCIITAIFTICALCTLLDEDNRGTRTVRTWERCHPSIFTGNIPEFVLYKAVRIAQALPAATFSIEYLVAKTETVIKRDPDPFLIASLGNEHLYIDVWDEKEYEATI